MTTNVGLHWDMPDLAIVKGLMRRYLSAAEGRLEYNMVEATQKQDSRRNRQGVGRAPRFSGHSKRSALHFVDDHQSTSSTLKPYHVGLRIL